MQCAICLDKIEEKDLYQTPCQHQFHFNCINQWKKNCPTCRGESGFDMNIEENLVVTTKIYEVFLCGFRIYKSISPYPFQTEDCILTRAVENTWSVCNFVFLRTCQSEFEHIVV